MTHLQDYDSVQIGTISFFWNYLMILEYFWAFLAFQTYITFFIYLLLFEHFNLFKPSELLKLLDFQALRPLLALVVWNFSNFLLWTRSFLFLCIILITSLLKIGLENKNSTVTKNWEKSSLISELLNMGPYFNHCVWNSVLKVSSIIFNSILLFDDFFV